LESNAVWIPLKALKPWNGRTALMRGVSVVVNTVAELLGVPAGSPVFSVERVTLLPNDKPFEFVQSTIRADKYSIVLDLVMKGAEQRQIMLRDPVKR